MDCWILINSIILEIFKMGEWKVMGFGKIKKAKNMLENGKIVKLTAKVSM